MTSDRPPFAPPPPTAPATNPQRRGLVIGLIATVVLGAAAVTVLVVVLLNRGAPEVGAASPTPSVQPTPDPTPSPTADPTPTPTPEPTPQTELTDGLSHLNYGARAEVAVDRLRVRYNPTTEGEAAAVITAGQGMLILSGPIMAEDFEWYFVELANRDEDELTQGWVAAVPAPAGSQPDDAWLIRIQPPTCPPAAVDTVMLARLTEYAITSCDVQVGTVQGLLDSCYEGPYGPFSYEPGWASFSCYFLRDRASTWFLPVYFPPEMERQQPERGDIVTLTGGLGVDPELYGACTVTSTAYEIPAEAVAIEQQKFKASCPAKFVVTGVSVEGHITMPPLGYY